MAVRVVALALVAGVLAAWGAGGLESPVVQAQSGPKFKVHKGEKIPGQYIVVLDDNDVPDDSLPKLTAITNELLQRHRGRRGYLYEKVIKGFSVRMTEEDARQLSEDPRVQFVAEDGVTHVATTQTVTVDQWGLDRIDQRAGSAADDIYNYNADGTGVNIYIVDTGIRGTHTEFSGRVHAAYNAVNDGVPPNQDCFGHGTQVAGIAAGTVSGVAKNAELYSVKTLYCDGTGSWSAYIAALDWISANAIKPAVVNASIGGGIDPAVAPAITHLVNSGIAFVGAAGNSGDDACNYLPGAAPDAITVGNMEYGDQRSSDSNFGSCVDIFAPGNAVSTAHFSDDTYTTLAWGTSMASPAVAGAAALYLQRHPTATPAQVRSEILRGTTKGVMVNTPPLGAGSPNKILFTPYLGDIDRPTATLTAPAQGASVSGRVTLSATASDNVELQGVRFFIGSTQVAFDTSAPYSFTWDSWTVANGNYAMKARAIDLAGNTKDSAAATITVANGAADTTPPEVSVNAAAVSSTVKGSVTFSANASDNMAIERVEFFVDGALIGTDRVSPYSVTWNTTMAADGTHTLTARAVDTSNNSRVSSGVKVTVDNVSDDTLPAGWTSTDVGAVGAAGSARFANGTWSLTGAGTDIINTADAFQFVHRSFTGDGDLVARVASVVRPSGAAAAYAGIMFRESLGANVRHATLLLGNDGKVKFRRRTTVGGTTASDGNPTGPAFSPQYIKLSRRGNVLTAWISTDGSAWTQVHTAQTVTLPLSTEVGIWTLRAGAVTGLAQATFTNVSVNASAGLPAGWNNVDVGAVGTAGNVKCANGSYTVNSAGTDIWGSADAFHFVYRTLTGDGTIVARLASVTKPADSLWAMAAIMMRDGFAANARHASIMVTTDGKAKFRRRTTVGGTTVSEGAPPGTTYAPRWLKLTRVGDAFTAYISTDGANWTTVAAAQSIALPPTIRVGLLALRSGGTGTAQAVFTNVSVTNP